MEPSLSTDDKALSKLHSPVQLAAIDADLNPSTGNLILAHPAQNIVHEEPANSDPLIAIDEDLLGEANDDDYEDSQALIMNEEEMADTLRNPFRTWRCPLSLLRGAELKREIRVSLGLATSME